MDLVASGRLAQGVLYGHAIPTTYTDARGLRGDGVPVSLRILPLATIATQFIVQRMTPQQPGADPQQQRIMMMMPLMFIFFFWSYFCIFNRRSSTIGSYSCFLLQYF